MVSFFRLRQRRWVSLRQRRWQLPSVTAMLSMNLNVILWIWGIVAVGLLMYCVQGQLAHRNISAVWVRRMARAGPAIA
jgi:hypothetical protein